MLKLEVTTALPPFVTNKQCVQSPKPNLEVKATMKIPSRFIVLRNAIPQGL
jgi:hypothetical protein